VTRAGSKGAELEMTMSGMDQSTMHAHLGMLLRAVVLGLSFTVVGSMGEGLPPILLTALRFTIAAVALVPLIWRAPAWRPEPRGLALYGLLGLCEAAFFGAMFWVAHRLSALSMASISVSVPFLSYCFGRAFRVEPPSRQLLGILALGACGALGLAWAENGRSLAAPGVFHVGADELVFLAGCIGLALYAVWSRWGLSRRLLSEQAGVRAFWSVVAGALQLGVFGVLTENARTLVHLTLSDLLLLAYLGVISTGGTFWLMQRAASVLTPSAVSAYGYAPPIVSMLVLFISEPQRISWRWLPGALLVMLAMTLLLRRHTARTSPSPVRGEPENHA
jgi:drug/metabolite transporter (DMT)-like permease